MTTPSDVKYDGWHFLCVTNCHRQVLVHCPGPELCVKLSSSCSPWVGPSCMRGIATLFGVNLAICKFLKLERESFLIVLGWHWYHSNYWRHVIVFTWYLRIPVTANRKFSCVLFSLNKHLDYTYVSTNKTICKHTYLLLSD